MQFFLAKYDEKLLWPIFVFKVDDSDLIMMKLYHDVLRCPLMSIPYFKLISPNMYKKVQKTFHWPC